MLRYVIFVLHLFKKKKKPYFLTIHIYVSKYDSHKCREFSDMSKTLIKFTNRKQTCILHNILSGFRLRFAASKHARI